MARIDDDLERSKRGQIDEGHHARHVGRAGLLGDVLPGAAVAFGAEILRLRQRLDPCEPGLCVERRRARADHLHAVVIHRIVRSGDADPAIGVEMAGGEIHLFGAREPEVQHPAARVLQPLRHRVRQRRRGCAHVAAQDHAPRVERPGEGTADAVGDPRVEIDAEPPPDVIGLETGEPAHPLAPGPRA